MLLETNPGEDDKISSENLSEGSSGRLGLLYAKADLTLRPGSTKVLCFNDIPGEPGEIAVHSVRLSYSESEFDLDEVITLQDHLQQDVFFQDIDDQIHQSPLYQARSGSIRVLPKPPKLRLTLSSMERNLFVDETCVMSLEIINGEDEEVDVNLQLQFSDEGIRGPTITWHDGDVVDEKQKLAGQIPSLESQNHLVSVKTGTQVSEHILQIKATYTIKSDPKTQIFVPLEKELIVQRPFESTHNFSPMLHHERWPHSFSLAEAESDGGQGLTQRYQLTSQIMNVANMAVNVERVEIETIEVQEAANCVLTPKSSFTPESLAPSNVKNVSFIIDVQKTELDDRRPTYVDLRLKVSWRPDLPGQTSMVSYQSIPELPIAFGEPRVLATASSLPDPSSTLQLDYMIENPSIYSLQFSVMMEVSDEFAFSGSKNIMMQLQPLSRQSVRYVLLPLVRGTWIAPQLRVYDVVFHKQLKILGADGVRNDKKGGISIWIDALE